MKKILVANRGEIAIRVLRAAKEMGISTVAVYSEADRGALHTRIADEAVCIGKASSSESYLNQEKIIEVSLALNVDGIHPGYGFLSENANFVEKVVEAGITFIGPSAESIKVMGSKLAAKAAVLEYNIPMIPGTDKAVDSVEEAKEICSDIGFPVLIKASAGGGGKGMRVVKAESEIEEQMKLATSEALSSFGDGSVFIERFVDAPRHIEVQVLVDNFGNAVHLFERECSVQRRHQKVVEEAPSAVMTSELREKMGNDAIQVAKSCNYSGVGTVEFLMDENLNYYFLEMNTRLQVEHPVTEMITGVDLVKEQVKVARNEKLGFNQEDLSINGHAIEVRVYAEDPLNGFVPDTGILTEYNPPLGPGVRVDDGYERGGEVSIYYDSMISKLIVHGETREEAIKRMIRAIGEYRIGGVSTTLSFGDFTMKHDAFVSGDFDTNFIDRYYKPELLGVSEDHQEVAAIIALNNLLKGGKREKKASSANEASISLWKANRLND